MPPFFSVSQQNRPYGLRLKALAAEELRLLTSVLFLGYIFMSTWKRFGVVVVRYATDHDPPHVHVFEDGRRTLKFDIEAWTAMEGKVTAKARRALEALREEGEI
jgi:hypothetical protein